MFFHCDGMKSCYYHVNGSVFVCAFVLGLMEARGVKEEVYSIDY